MTTPLLPLPACPAARAGQPRPSSSGWCASQTRSSSSQRQAGPKPAGTCSRGGAAEVRCAVLCCAVLWASDPCLQWGLYWEGCAFTGAPCCALVCCLSVQLVLGSHSSTAMATAMHVLISTPCPPSPACARLQGHGWGDHARAREGLGPVRGWRCASQHSSISVCRPCLAWLFHMAALYMPCGESHAENQQKGQASGLMVLAAKPCRLLLVINRSCPPFPLPVCPAGSMATGIYNKALGTSANVSNGASTEPCSLAT